MNAVAQVVTDLLGLAGYDDPAKAPFNTLQRVLSDVNAIGQRLLSSTPDSWWAIDDGAETLRAPVAVSGLTLTAGAKTITGGAFETWMHGCSIQLSGEVHVNEIRRTGASTYELKIPFSGSNTASGAGTVYCDAINLARTAIAVQRPLFIPQRWELQPALNISDLRRMNNLRSHRTADRNLTQYPFLWLYMQINVPTAYLIEQSPQYTGEVLERIRVYPMPDSAYPLTWKQKITFTPVTSLADTRLSLCPHQYLDSVFLPLARRKFAGWPEFKGDRQLAMADAAEAEGILNKLAEKQPHREIFIDPRGGF